jgi:Ca2+-binding RTX toxin-like protein
MAMIGTIGSGTPSAGLVVAKIVDVNGTDGADILHGTDDHNMIKAFDGDDVMYGYAGDDAFFGGNGADYIDGGTGTYDTVFYSDSTVGVTVNLALGFGRYGTAEGDTLVNIDDIIGSKYRDTLIGNDGSNRLMGEEGNDRLTGGFGADALYGGDGGGDVNAPAGIDTAVYSDSPVGVTVNLQTGRGYGGTAEGDTLFSIEQIEGSFHNDVLTGNDVANFLHGAGGSDILKGAGGDDILYGAGDNDTLKGGGGADVLEGGTGIDTAAYNESPAGVFVSLNDHVAAYGDAEDDVLVNIENLTGSLQADNLWGDGNANVLNGIAGNDVLKGYGGADRLLGGEGADRFVFTSVGDALPLGAGSEYIPDFNEAQGDKIDLGQIDANVLVAGNQAFTPIGVNVAFNGAAGELRFNNGLLEGDVNGDRLADFQIHLDVAGVSAGALVL